MAAIRNREGAARKEHDLWDRRKPLIAAHQIDPALAELRRLRLTGSNMYLRSASTNPMNGVIAMTFSCDGSHYIDYDTFFAKLERLGTPECGT